jgi:glycosyltransferase involved in cell wall biosynthesis
LTNALCIVDDAPIHGGAERFALRLACEVRRAMHQEVLVVCPRLSELHQRCEDLGIPTRAAEFPPPFVSSVPRLVPALAKLRRILVRAAPATLVGNTARAQFYSVLALGATKRDIRVVHIAHEQASIERRQLRALYRHRGRLLVVGAGATRSYAERLPGVAVQQINNFLSSEELERLASIEPPRPGTRAATIGVLGRMVPEKGFIELLEELAAIRDAWHRVHIAAFVEQHGYERAVRTRISDLDLSRQVTLAGPTRNVANFLAHIDVLIVPSTGSEGQPTVILEALAARRRVIVRRQIASSDFEDLGVLAYSTPSELRAALLATDSSFTTSATAGLIRERFGAAQVLNAIAAGGC